MLNTRSASSVFLTKWILSLAISLIYFSPSIVFAKSKPNADIKGVYFKKERHPVTDEKYYEVRVKSTQRGSFSGGLKIYAELIDKEGVKYLASGSFNFGQFYNGEFDRETWFEIPNLAKAKVNAYWVGFYHDAEQKVLLDSKDKNVDSLKSWLRKVSNHIPAEIIGDKSHRIQYY